MKPISESNPNFEEMGERGWAWILRERVEKKHGAPFTDDEYATDAVYRHHPEERDEDFPEGEYTIMTTDLIIVSWE